MEDNNMLRTTLTSFIILWGTLTSAVADTRDNAIALFQFAESTYPELLLPANPETQEIQGYYVRYYAGTGIYLGVQGDNVYAVGGPLGDTLQSVGKIGSLIEIAATDISDKILINRRAECSYYADNFISAVLDLQRNSLFNGSLSITVDSDECVFASNSIPNNDFNDSSAAFATAVSAVNAEYRVTTTPKFADAVTPISLTTDNAILLNGVKIDLLAAGCYGVGDGAIGCNDMSQPWRYDPMSPLTRFGTDNHNAHTQPDGSYHYHGNPKALFEQDGNVESPVVGFAADGFPVYGSYIDDNGQIRAVTSSYRLKSGSRPSGSGNPGGTYDGTYVDDYEYVAGSGDLDECNGMMRNGDYGYYIVNAYPWVLACYKGTTNSSFDKTGFGATTTSSGGTTSNLNTSSSPPGDSTTTGGSPPPPMEGTSTPAADNSTTNSTPLSPPPPPGGSTPPPGP
jgi:hypothetical protein